METQGYVRRKSWKITVKEGGQEIFNCQKGRRDNQSIKENKYEAVWTKDAGKIIENNEK